MGQRLGQHFLNNPHYAQVLAQSVGARPGGVILEIGPGTGVLTRELLKTGARVVAVEKDNALAEKLRTTFTSEITSGNLNLHVEDIRNFDPGTHPLLTGDSYVLAANIPYYITGEILRKFLSSKNHPVCMSLLVQREVAQRVIATKESILSISIKIYGTPKIVATVSKGNFTPPPSVDSAILLIRDISKTHFRDILEEDFFRVLRAGFSSKRKLAINNLAGIFEKERVLTAFSKCAIALSARAETLSAQQWLALTHALLT